MTAESMLQDKAVWTRVVAFDTIFPGPYNGCATHEHVIAHTEVTINLNGAYSSGNVSHLSQLINAVEATSPYSTNTTARTRNNAKLFTRYSATAAYDPFSDYIILGTYFRMGSLRGLRLESGQRMNGTRMLLIWPQMVAMITRTSI
jgi:hypothetical protein